ncbi:hypothetical protein [Bacillus sp. N35-10-4]|uniref:hypothetical protein n=1 Tax=Bacillus sp. N35-10-4 TaxID=1866315 RepID=UPI000AD2F231|nr:hypothetical protein [Bacillus sp. N35-10-4]
MLFNSFYYEAINNGKKENVTSYADESWHMRYVGAAFAKLEIELVVTIVLDNTKDIVG